MKKNRSRKSRDTVPLSEGWPGLLSEGWQGLLSEGLPGLLSEGWPS